MSWMPIEWARRDHHAAELTSELSPGLRIASNVLRALFILCLLLITLRVSMPQNETIWTAYDTPGDLVRMALGLGGLRLAGGPALHAAEGRPSLSDWLYLGLVAVPFAAICLVAVW